MNADELASLFEEALSLPSHEREALLVGVRSRDAELHAELSSLLNAAERAPQFFERLSEVVIAPSLDAVESGQTADGTPRIVSHYQLGEPLGVGGMGVVYRARDLRLQRPVALKFLPSALTSNALARRRLIQEARTASALDHPNVCTIYEVDETPDGRVFIAMALYDGETLRQRLLRGPIPPDEAVRLAAHLCDALAAAHRQGVIHRDLKPANVMLTSDGRVKLLDFGLARMQSGTDLTQSGSRLGTLAYMSPEQIRGEALDVRSDLWSLGVVLYEMLAGQRPFRGDGEVALLYAILDGDYTPVSTKLPAVEPWLDSLVDRLLSRDREGRPPHAQIVLNTLAGERATEVVPSGRRPRHIAAIATLVLTSAALLVGLSWRGRTVGASDAARGSSLAPAGATRVSRIAIFPFAVRGTSELAYLREGMVDLLSTSLHGVGDIRIVDPHALFAQLDAGADSTVGPGEAREVAMHFSAGSYVLGTVVAAGTQVQLIASLYDSAGTEQVRAQTVANDASALLAAVDELAQRLVVGQLRDPASQLASLAALTTSSFPALRDYLEGERALRGGRPEIAIERLQRAVAADSQFALAWYQLARAAGWSAATTELNMRAAARAMQHGSALPARARALIDAYYAYRVGDPAEVERLCRQILATHPDDLEALLLLGETRFHNNPFLGRSTADAADPLMQVLRADPSDREVLIHLMDLAARDKARDRLDSLTARYVQPAAGGEGPGVREAYALLPSLASTAQPARTRALAALEAAGSDALSTALFRLAPAIGELELADNIASALSGPTHAESFRFGAWIHRAMFAVARGDWTAASRAWQEAERLDPEWTLVHRALSISMPSTPVSPDVLRTLREQLTAWNPGTSAFKDGLHAGERPDIRQYLLGLLAWRQNDRAAVAAAAASLSASASQSGGRDLPRSFSLSLRALLAWQDGRTTDALAMLDAAQLKRPFHARARSPFLGQHANRFARAGMLRDLGRHEESAAWLRTLRDGYFHWGVIYDTQQPARTPASLDRLSLTSTP